MDLRLVEILRTIRIPLELNAKPGGKILIITDTRMDPVLWQAMAAAANEMRLEPTVAIMTPRRAHGYDPASPIVHAVRDPDIDLCIYLTSTALAHAPMTDQLLEAGKRFILMEELTPDMLLPGGPADADYVAMNELGNKVARVFTEGRRIRVQCENGTDLSAGIEGRPGRAFAAKVWARRPSGGGGCAFPDGETHICPVEGTGEGTVVFDLTAHSVGRLRDPIRLTVEKGMVTRIEGGAQASRWKEILEKDGDRNSYNCPAEIALGLNPNVTPTGVMRTDKKLYGASHIGVGDTVTLGGTCHAKLRLEGVIAKPVITVDGRIVAEGGRITVA
jgi:leucyl aminopeptidase (aminopeptidase T)